MISDILDAIHDELRSGSVEKGMEDLICTLGEVHQVSDRGQWAGFAKSCLSHPIKDTLHEDPFTSRAFNKPRGYPGDAGLIDMIYFPESVDLDNVSDRSRKIFEYTTSSPACKAVRYRKDLLAQYIDDVTENKEKPKVLSIACGHLREGEIASSVKNNRLGELIALDYDQKSLEVVKKNFLDKPVSTLHLSIFDILKRKGTFPGMDLIYSAGLYDYLNVKTAKRLTKLLFDMLSPGGWILLANFLDGIKDVGYMETYMGWHLTFRNEMDMVDLTGEIPRREIDRIEIFSEKEENLTFLKLVKGQV
ncbi:MAG: class I SAM-dependent methyltransferase [Desulfobacterales bacterium]|nr:class I SAM-dependent methyltransferase [Desulfobacterales bacterium]